VGGQAVKSRFPVAGGAIEKYQQFVEITEIIAGDAEAMAGVAAGAAESSTLARAGLILSKRDNRDFAITNFLSN
jgi:hypothetical protein